MADIHNQFNNSTFENTAINYQGVSIYKQIGDTPILPNLFIGREKSTMDIHQKLIGKNNALILINGTGGIGKTTMASQYYYDYFDFYSHLIWAVSEKGIKEAIVSLAFSLEMVFPKNLNQDQQINEIFKKISELKKPVLFVIDNANELDDLKQNHNLIRKVHNIHILLTSRIDRFEHIDTYKVEHLDKKAAIRLFKYHFPNFNSKEQKTLEKILEAIGYNTLVIELLAKNLNEYNTDLSENYPIKKLLEDIQQKGVLAISKSTKVTSDYRLNYAKPEEIISTMYDISRLTESEKQVLSVFAVLPALSIHFDFLKLFLPTIKELDSTLNKLTQKGWLDKSDKNFKTNPIISEIVRKQNKNKLEEHLEHLISVFIDRLVYQTGTGHIEGDYSEIEKYIQYADTLTNQTRFFSTNFSILYERLGNFYFTYGNLEKALKYYENYFKLKKELYDSNPKNVGFKNGLAISCEKLGNTQTALGDLDKALKYYEDYFKHNKELSESNPQNINFKNGFAISYEKLGDTHASLGNLDKALFFFEDYFKLKKELSESNLQNVNFKNGLAISYEKLGNTHTALGDLDKALEHYEDEFKLKKELYDSNPQNVGFKNGLAISYSKLGETYSSLGDMDGALKFFEDFSNLMKELSESNSQNLGFKNGLAISYEKLGITHASLGNLNKALSFFEDDLLMTKELSESNPQNVNFKSGLAISYIELGAFFTNHLHNKIIGVEFLNKAKDLLEELTNKYPMYKEFENNYTWVINKIEGI